MFKQEAEWIGEVLSAIDASGLKEAANLGSSTLLFRTKVQPHIQERIIDPLKAKGWQICHIDMKAEDGVDIVADVSDPEIALRFKDRFGLTICTNMLEHVTDIDLVVKNLQAITSDGGYIMLSVPYRYRVHHDPIDNGFRPTPNEILGLFPAERIICVAKRIISITDRQYYPVKKSRFPLWGYRERIAFFFGKRHKVSGVLINVKK